MAGEWIPIDCNIATKPEVLELCDICDLEPDVVIGRIVQLWLWAALNADSGEAKMTPPRLSRTFGGDVDFWNAVKEVGWLEIDSERRTITVPGWKERFSQAAKERALKTRRAAVSDAEKAKRSTTCAQAQDVLRSSAGPPAPERSRGEERREEDPPPPPRDEVFEELRAAWNAGPGKPWKPHTLPKGRGDVLSDPEWLPAALEAIPRLAGCKYFDTPPTLAQFMGPGFVENVLGGTYDAPKNATKRAFATGRPDDRPPPRQFDDDTAERKRLTLAKLAAAEAARVAG